MDNMKGINGPVTCYAPAKPEAEAKGPKPPVTCYAPMKDKVSTGSDEATQPNKGKVPTATCYMPVDDGGGFFLGKEAAPSGLSDVQIQNRMDLAKQHNHHVE